MGSRPEAGIESVAGALAAAAAPGVLTGAVVWSLASEERTVPELVNGQFLVIPNLQIH